MQLPYANLQVTHQNPGAQNKLVIPVQVVCNTSDEEIYENIRINSRRPGEWVKVEEEHNGIAVLCGSGPSLADQLHKIRNLVNVGAKVFAMNGAANFLHSHGITPDYQVMIDARKETASLVGPAKKHLFASQVHPECWDRAPNAQLWHLQIGAIENEFPEYTKAYALIGGAASVGNTATCLAYAMGYRDLQIFGYDSSHRDGKGHAFHQKMNDGDPCAIVNFNGKEYMVSLTMKLQAEKFQETAKALQEGGCKIEVHGDGLLPAMFANPDVVLSEYEKYERMWQHPEYRVVSPGEMCADRFVDIVNPKPLKRIVDYGCGTGKGSLKLRELTECEIIQTDFTTNSRNENAKDFKFIQCDLTKEIPISGDYGFCTDVMEHIEPENVEATIKNIMGSSPLVFFQISTVPDRMGAIIGQQLHLTVKPHKWWKEKFETMGYNVLFDEEQDIASLFVISTTPLKLDSVCNTETSIINRNLVEAVKLGLPTIEPIPDHELHVCLVGGGPSLADKVEEIRALKHSGHKVWAVNNVHDYLVERGIVPDVCVLLDARKENAAFVKNARDDVLYYVASQCDPEVFKALKGKNVVVYHNATESAQAVLEPITNSDFCLLGGGTTVGMKALVIARFIGYKNIHLYGFDSSYRDKGHAYPQPANDKDRIMEITCEGRKFKCAPWMAVQADDFVDTYRMLLKQGCTVAVKGDGLIPYIAECISKQLEANNAKS